MTKLLLCIVALVTCLLCLVSSKKLSQESIDNQIKIPKDLQRRLAAVTDFTQLTEQFLIPTNSSLNETEEYEFVNRSLVRRARTVSSTRNVEELAAADACSPRETTVTIPQDDDRSTVFWPFCTKVVRCGGCCSDNEFVCAPVKSSIKLIPITVMVMAYPFEGAKKLFRVGTRQLPMEVHGECQQVCRVKETDCSKHQKYNPDDCACECTVAKYNCPSSKSWSEQSCACECDEVKECTGNQQFSRDTCMCELGEMVKDGCQIRNLVGSKVDLRNINTHTVSKNKEKNQNFRTNSGNDGRKVGEIRTANSLIETIKPIRTTKSVITTTITPIPTTKSIIETTIKQVAVKVKVAEKETELVKKTCQTQCPPFHVPYTDKEGKCECKADFG